MGTTEKQITVSNRELYEMTLKLDSLSSTIEQAAICVSEIGLSESDKELEMNYMPRNICSSLLYILADYTECLEKRLTNIISKAGGDL